MVALHATTPAEATTLLIALGAVRPQMRDLGVLLAGIALVAVLGEGLRRLRLAATDEDGAAGEG